MPERLRGVFTMRRYTNPRLPLPLPLLKGNDSNPLVSVTVTYIHNNRITAAYIKKRVAPDAVQILRMRHIRVCSAQQQQQRQPDVN